MHKTEIKDVFKELTATEKGLSNSQAEERLHKYGLNELKAEEGVRPLKILLEQFYSPLVWILLSAFAISIFLHEAVDAIVIAIIVIVNAVLGFVQEYRAERSIKELKKLSSLKAKVLRDGKVVKIDNKYLVPGDIIILETGDKVPADARLFEVYDLETQEASLTGESLPVTKYLLALAEKTPLAERNNMVYSSTIISKGKGKAVVTKTGMDSEVGKIATLIKETKSESTPLQKKLSRLGKGLTITVVIVAIVVFVAGLLAGNSISVMFLTAVALAVAAIPEGLPAIITISLAIGVQRMVRRNALVRKLPSVETLGSVSVICSDKTGTLTHNEMTVKKIWTNNQIYEISGSGYEAKGNFSIEGKLANPEPLVPILKCGMLCNDAYFESKGRIREVLGDPTEAALMVSAEKAGMIQEKINSVEKRVDEIPFSSERKMMTTIHKTAKGSVSYTKGAPDVIIANCDKVLLGGKIVRLEREMKKKILAANETFAQEALRVLGLAYKDKDVKKGNAEKEMIFLGLQAMIDPPREEAKEAIQKCHQAGIRVIMITGDQLSTAAAIAAQLGIKGKAITGQQLDEMKNLNKEIENIGVFARVDPAHKLTIIDTLKNKGYIVAMTGDGVNDAPALKKADIGIAMGITGTDVAKEASDMVLTDDNFASIVSAIEEGRGIFDNIRKFVNYLLSSNLGEIMLILLASLFGMPLPLTAIQILWINLVTDGLPAVALGVDPYAKGIMQQKPRQAKENLISKKLGYNIIILGVLIGAATLIIFWLYQNSPLIKAQTMAFSALVVFEIVRLQMIRSDYKLGIFSNKYLVMAVLSSLLLQFIVIYVPFLNNVFNTVPLDLIDWVWIFVASAAMIGLGKVLKLLRKK